MSFISMSCGKETVSPATPEVIDFLPLSDVEFDSKSGTILGLSDSYNGDYCIVIPPYFIIDNKQIAVTSIGKEAFMNDSLTCVTIPSSILKIGSSAFKNNYISELIFEERQKKLTIEDYAFNNNRLSSTTLPDSLECDVTNAFSDNIINEWAGFNYILLSNQAMITKYNSNQIELIIPMSIDNKSVTYIGSQVFREKELQGVEIPNSVKIIGNYSFIDNSIQSLTIPNSVTRIGISAFNFNSIKNLILEFGLVDIGDNAFSNNYIWDLSLPSSVKVLGKNAFYGNHMRTVNIPESVEYIGMGAFNSNSLTNLNIPNSVTYLGAGAFKSNDLTNVSLSTNITIIEGSVFQGNDLTTINIPNLDKPEPNRKTFNFTEWNY